VAFRGLPSEVAERLHGLLAANRFGRWRSGLVPKLTSRTIGIDFWE
jgi:hypothetical protein